MILLKNCNALYRCYYCEQFSKEHRIATIRVFSGVAGYSGGYPACDEHRQYALNDGLRPLILRESLAPGYTVTAFEVIDDGHGFPTLGRALFEARPRVSTA